MNSTVPVYAHICTLLSDLDQIKHIKTSCSLVYSVACTYKDNSLEPDVLDDTVS
jgi:hypothetical protein